MTTFTEARAEVDALIEGSRRLDKAYAAAEALTKTFPQKAEAWFMLNLVVSISNRGPGVSHGSQQYVRLASKCPDFTRRLHGDMLRDQAIGVARFCHGNELANAEPVVLEKVRELHRGDGNRQACRVGVLGRIRCALGDYRAAARFHEEADDWWRELGSAADAGWVHRNLVEWLRAEIILGGTNSNNAQTLYRRIKESGRNTRRANLLMKPLIGLTADRWLITHR